MDQNQQNYNRIHIKTLQIKKPFLTMGLFTPIILL